MGADMNSEGGVTNAGRGISGGRDSMVIRRDWIRQVLARHYATILYRFGTVLFINVEYKPPLEEDVADGEIVIYALMPVMPAVPGDVAFVSNVTGYLAPRAPG